VTSEETGAELLLRLCVQPEWTGTDSELVKLALRHFRNLCSNFVSGGMYHERQLAEKALEAFDRIMTPKLPGGEW